MKKTMNRNEKMKISKTNNMEKSNKSTATKNEKLNSHKTSCESKVKKY